MGRSFGTGRATCETCISIDVRRWHREGRLHAGHDFSWSWTRGGEAFGNIRVHIEPDAAVLLYSSRSHGDAEWKPVEQRVPLTWTPCHLGGRRPWFVCPVYSGGRYCGRRVAVLYGAGELFACPCCYGLAYASQHEAVRHRGLWKAQKIRMRLGGSPSLGMRHGSTFRHWPRNLRGMHLD